MAKFFNQGIEIEYLDRGEGDPVLLIHGFGSTKETNWVGPGWFEPLIAAGFRVIALDMPTASAPRPWAGWASTSSRR
jgi:pimeloyl-ACP methyl ester carboxylesterase